MPFELDYDQLIHLDAESLAEAGIAEAYRELLPKLREYVDSPEPIIEILDNDICIYSVRFRDAVFTIYSPEIGEENEWAWSRATFAFFTIVNDQLAHSTHRLFAINGGNDLFGMFLTPAQSVEARTSLPNPTDWPYLPLNEKPWFGMYH